MSLIKVATLCDYMLVPTEEEAFSTFNGGKSVEDIPGYGVRGWCRLENFIFSLWSELKNREVALYAVTRNGKLQHHPKVKIFKGGMPHSGDFFHLNDSGHVVMLENTMIEKCARPPLPTALGDSVPRGLTYSSRSPIGCHVSGMASRRRSWSARRARTSARWTCLEAWRGRE